MADMINHPPHYGAHPSGIECIDIIEPFGFNVGSAIKYLWRAGLKGSAIEDLLKAHWYVVREIGRLQRQLAEAELTAELREALARVQVPPAAAPEASTAAAEQTEEDASRRRRKGW